MAEWIFEEGIGEHRAALVESGEIVEALIERAADPLQPGAILPARLAGRPAVARFAFVRLEGGEEALLEPVPAGLSEGAQLLVEITRAALTEHDRAKRARARPAATGADPRPAPSLRQRLAETGQAVRRLLPTDPDELEHAGWSDLLEACATGTVSFPGGTLRISLTPAMTLIDVDGAPPALALARAAATAVGRTVRRMGIGGSIGIDFPTLASRAERTEVGELLDAALPQPFERTGVNGFGFAQIVRPRPRASLPELIQGEPPLAAALALLRRAERTAGVGPRTIVAAPAVAARLAEGTHLHQLERSIGAPVVLQPDPRLAIFAGHVQAEHPQAR